MKDVTHPTLDHAASGLVIKSQPKNSTTKGLDGISKNEAKDDLYIREAILLTLNSSLLHFSQKAKVKFLRSKSCEMDDMTGKLS